MAWIGHARCLKQQTGANSFMRDLTSRANDFTNSHPGGNVIGNPPKAGVPPCQTRHRLPNMPEKIWLVLAHTVLSVPIVMIIITAALRTYDLNQERVAQSLGSPGFGRFLKSPCHS